jgi:methyltransferase (TIGR00027 family)
MRDDAPSRTARGVAAHRLNYERLEAAYGDPAADEALTRDVADGLRRGPDSPRHEYLRARTAFFDRVVVNSVEHRVRQVVVGAAGYDGRAFRYARPGVRWFEVDHPATQADKLARIARLGLGAGRITFVAADFTTDPVADLLTAAGLDISRTTLFLLEGVAAYLEQPVLERVLAEFRAVTVPGGLLAISVSPGNAPSADRDRFRAAVAAVGEPIRSTLSAAAARELLAGAGWQVSEGGRERLRSAGLLLARAAASSPRPERSRPPHRTSSSAPAVSPPSPVTGRLPLSALLSQALVAFTIEADNEAEHRLPHRTQDYGRSAGAGADAPWQTSLVMWANCLRHVPDDGITVAGMREAARTGTNVDGMRRWGYVTYTPDPGHGKRPRPDAVVRLTPGGRRARDVWNSVPAEIEQRWRDRFGAPAVDSLRAALGAVVADLDPRLPDCLPILHPGLFSEPDLPDRLAAPDAAGPTALSLWALLSRTLLAFATEFEADSGRSLAISANLLRVLTEDGVRSRDVPGLAGIAKAAVGFTMGPAAKQGLVAEEPDPAGSRWKITRLTAPGARAQRACADLTAAIEDRWRARFGAERVAALRAALEPLAVGDPPPLFAGLTPYPDGWRARVQAPAVLPHYPMVLHRGGYPDGA